MFYLIIIFSIIVGIVTFFKWKYSYWSSKNIPYIEPRIFLGTLENPLFKKTPVGIHVQKYYEHFKSLNYKYGGLYSPISPILLVVDLDIIRNVMVKDFDHFSDRGIYYNRKRDPLNAHLVKITGHKWRNLRAQLTPTFTSGKLKTMFPTLVACAEPLGVALDEYCKKKTPLDIKEVLACYTTDVIGSCAFGLDCNSFTDPDSEFRKYGREIFAMPVGLKVFKRYIAFSFPTVAELLDLTIIDRKVENFFLNVVRKTLDYRASNQVIRQDFMQLLMNLKKEGGLTFEEIAAQAYVFFAAGFETSSSTMAFCLFELAKNQDIQHKLREEINKVLVKYNGEITYDSIMEMKYLNNVIEETLRKYPTAGVLQRICVKDYTLPGTRDVIDKGTIVFIPVHALHHDPTYFPNPEKFNPDRFSDANKSSIVPFTYLPFGEGPRICIGLRFGLMQTKVGLVVLLKNFNVSLNSKTQLPLKFHPRTSVLTATPNIWLDIEKV